MNVYDFDKTIYSGDSTADFYLFSLKKHKKIITLAPSLLGSAIRFYVFKKGSKTDFKQVMYRFLRYCDIDKDVNDFWEINQNKIKKYYLKQKRDDDVIISASPEFLLEPIIKKLKIGTTATEKKRCAGFMRFFLTEKSKNFIPTVTATLPLRKLRTRRLWLTAKK